MKFKETYTPIVFNTTLGIIGLSGVWFASHNGWAVFWAFIAALHITFTKKTD
jgi:hypothetical protein